MNGIGNVASSATSPLIGFLNTLVFPVGPVDVVLEDCDTKYVWDSFREADAVCRRHSDQRLQCSPVLHRPKLSHRLCSQLSGRLARGKAVPQSGTSI